MLQRYDPRNADIVYWVNGVLRHRDEPGISPFDSVVWFRHRNEELFEGISPYVVQDGARARLLIGPFRNDKEATIFMEDLASVRIDAFTWTSQPGQAVRKIPSE